MKVEPKNRCRCPQIGFSDLLIINDRDSEGMEMADGLPEESGSVLPLGPQSLIYLRSKHGSYLRAPSLGEGVVEDDLCLVHDRSLIGTEFLLRRLTNGFLTLSDPLGKRFVFASTEKAGWGGGFSVKFGIPYDNRHVWKENRIGEGPKHFRLVPHRDSARSLVAGKLGPVPPRTGVAIKHTSRFQYGWNSWTCVPSGNPISAEVIPADPVVAIPEPEPSRFVDVEYQEKYIDYFGSRPELDYSPIVAVVSPQSGDGKTSLINTCRENDEAHVSQSEQGTTDVKDYRFEHGGLSWTLRDTPGLSGKHHMPNPSPLSDPDGKLTPEQFVKRYGLGEKEVDGILFVTS